MKGGKAPVVNVDKMEDDPQRRKPDISRALKYLGWKPKVVVHSLSLNLRFPPLPSPSTSTADQGFFTKGQGRESERSLPQEAVLCPAIYVRF